MIFDEITARIIGCCINVHQELGPGLLESVYESALSIELLQQGMRFERQMKLPVVYKGETVGVFRVDLLVEDKVVVELKSTERHEPVYEAQLLSYMKLGGYKVGLLVNFNSVLVSKGIKRFLLP